MYDERPVLNRLSTFAPMEVKVNIELCPLIFSLNFAEVDPVLYVNIFARNGRASLIRGGLTSFS
ncbi:hypothetical protein LguiB_001089 [Lonicera macranthoides]